MSGIVLAPLRVREAVRACQLSGCDSCESLLQVFPTAAEMAGITRLFAGPPPAPRSVLTGPERTALVFLGKSLKVDNTQVTDIQSDLVKCGLVQLPEKSRPSSDVGREESTEGA